MASSAAKLSLFEAIQDNPSLLNLLSIAVGEEPQKEFLTKVANLQEAPSGFIDPENEDAFKDFMITYGHICSIHPRRFSLLQAANRARKELKEDLRRCRRDFMDHIGLTTKPELSENFIKTLREAKRYEVSRLAPDEVYPPAGHHIVESDKINKMWSDHLKNDKQPDKRLPRRPLHFLRPEELQLDLRADDDAYIVDKDSGEVIMIVIRNFCGHPELLQSLNDTVENVVDSRKSVRLEDPGKYVLTGFSTGSRSRPSFHWVRNLLSRRWSGDEEDEMNREIAAAYSLMWMLIKARLPPEAFSDIDSWLANTGVPRMNAEILGGSFRDIYFKIGQQKITVPNAEGSPPAGGAAANYSRPIHKEGQPYKFAFSWTFLRTLTDDQGGHFYNSAYGIRVRGGSDSLVAWDPHDWHGTSLQEYPPTSKTILPSLVQTGIAITTPKKLESIWGKYRDRLCTYDEAVDQLATDSGDEIVYDPSPEESSFYITGEGSKGVRRSSRIAAKS